jgi:hypothetical protein
MVVVDCTNAHSSSIVNVSGYHRLSLGTVCINWSGKEGTEVRTVGLQTALSVVVHFYGVEYVESRIVGLRDYSCCFFS